MHSVGLIAGGCFRRLRPFDKLGAEPLQAAEAATDSTFEALSVPSFPEANYEVSVENIPMLPTVPVFIS